MMNANSNLYKFGFGTRNEYGDEYMAYGIGGTLSDLATWIFGDATYKVKKWLDTHGEEPITSIIIGRVPIEKAINYAMEALSGGEFKESALEQGYDGYFHLFLVLNNTYRIEKNQNVNLITPYNRVEKEERFDVSLSGLKGKTIAEFIQNGVERMGANDYWQNYDGLIMNCQNWVSQNLKANGVDSQGAEDFYYQNTDRLQRVIKPGVKDAVKEVTSVASAVDKLLSWISGGAWGLRRGGRVGKKQQYGGTVYKRGARRVGSI
jgi:hypothetical protein